MSQLIARPVIGLPEPPRARITCLAFTPHRSGSLVGFADLHIPTCRLKLFGCAVHASHGKRWVQLPAKARLDSARELVRDDRGRPQYTPVVAWDTAAVNSAFGEAAVAAIEAYDPRAFDPEG